MSQSSTTQSPRTRKTAFAVGAMLVMVGVACAAAMYIADDDEAAATNAYGTGSETAPVASLAALSAPLAGFDEAASVATGAAAAAQASAEAEAGIAAALATIDEASAGADAVLAGTDGGIDAYLGAASAYDISALRAQFDVEGRTGFLWTSMPRTVFDDGDEVHLEETGQAEVDDAFLQAEAIIAQIQAMWGSPEVQTLFATADQAAAEQGAPVRTPGLLRSPFGADDTVEPDEAGAAAAQAHADAMLSTVQGGYGTLQAGLQEARSGQEGLAEDVDSVLATATAFGQEAHTYVAAQHAAQLEAIASVGAEYEALLGGSAAAYAAGLTDAAAAADAELDATLAAQHAAIENNTADTLGQLDAYIASVRAEAEARVNGIADAEAAVQAGAEAGTISAADAEAFFAASAAATAQVEAQVSGAEAEVDALRVEVQQQADAALAEIEGRVADARSEIEARVAESRMWADAQVAMLGGDVDGALAASVQGQADVRAQAEAAIDCVVVAHRAEVEARAYAAVADARAYAAVAQATVDQVQGEAYTEIGHDLGYIQAVVDDYASLPTPERQAAADAWAAVQGELDAGLGGVLMQGSGIAAEASAVLDAAAQAEAALDARF